MSLSSKKSLNLSCNLLVSFSIKFSFDILVSISNDDATTPRFCLSIFSNYSVILDFILLITSCLTTSVIFNLISFSLQ